MFVFDIWLTLPLMLSALPQTVFVLVFALPSLGAGQWWRDDVGRALFFKSLTLAALLDVLVLRVFYFMAKASDVTLRIAVPDSNWDRLFSALYWLIFAGIVYQLVVLIRKRCSEA